MVSGLKHKTLYYFTLTYPYGSPPQWKENELKVLSRYFRRIVVVPLSDNGGSQKRQLIDGIEYTDPIIGPEHVRLDRSVFEKSRLVGELARSPVLVHFLREMLSPNVFTNPRRVRQLIKAAYEIALFAKSPILKSVFKSMTSEDSVAYFYWGIGQVNALLLKKRRELPFAACRFHGWDLYEERHVTAYIPFRKRLLKSLDMLLPCSEHGKQYMEDRWGPLGSKVVTARLGTLSTGRSELKDDGELKIVSCSHVVAVKRLDLLCEALRNISIPVRWTHIGDGELMPVLRKDIDSLPPNVRVDLRGAVASEEVAAILSTESFDIFVNTSSSEGVPVSIMEAFAAGIPVLATNVGGTSEIVDDSVGRLVPSAVNASELAWELGKLFSIDKNARSQLRDNAFSRFKERCDAHTNAEILAEVLSNAVVRHDRGQGRLDPEYDSYSNGRP